MTDGAWVGSGRLWKSRTVYWWIREGFERACSTAFGQQGEENPSEKNCRHSIVVARDLTLTFVADYRTTWHNLADRGKRLDDAFRELLHCQHEFSRAWCDFFGFVFCKNDFSADLFLNESNYKYLVWFRLFKGKLFSSNVIVIEDFEQPSLL